MNDLRYSSETKNKNAANQEQFAAFGKIATPIRLQVLQRLQLVGLLDRT